MFFHGNTIYVFLEKGIAEKEMVSYYFTRDIPTSAYIVATSFLVCQSTKQKCAPICNKRYEKMDFKGGA